MQSQKPELLLLSNNDESKAHFDSNFYLHTQKETTKVTNQSKADLNHQETKFFKSQVFDLAISIIHQGKFLK